MNAKQIAQATKIIQWIHSDYSRQRIQWNDVSSGQFPTPFGTGVLRECVTQSGLNRGADGLQHYTGSVRIGGMVFTMREDYNLRGQLQFRKDWHCLEK